MSPVEQPAPDDFTLVLPVRTDSPRAARAEVLRQCQEWGLDGVAGDAALIVSELVTNVVLHARTPAGVRLVRLADGIRLEVSDESTRPLRSRAPQDDATPGGRGLLLVDALAARFGVDGQSAGKTVWAELHAPA